MPRWLYLALLVISTSVAIANEAPQYGVQLEGFEYPFPVQHFELSSQGHTLQMAYMDVQPEQAPNGRTVVLLHGKNFCAATWEATIKALSAAGYRVVVPDQIGFCKSTKPARYQYSFHQLAANTRELLDGLEVKRHVIMGHSMGGMLATRYALLYPERVEQLILVNPIGLEDWLAEGVPYRTIDEWYATEHQTTAQSIRNYQKSTYYAGEWHPDFDRWVQMQAGLLNGPGRQLVTWNSALHYDMILTQPVAHEFDRLKVPTLLLIGEKDNTAVGKSFAPEPVRKRLGQYSRLAQDTAARIPEATLHTFPKLGHSPHIQAPEAFHTVLLQQLQGAGQSSPH